MTPNLEYITKCRVPGCNKEFVSTPVDIPIIGQPNARTVKFVTALMEHVQKKHPQMMQNIAGAIQDYTGFLVVSLFEVNDPKLLEMREHIRAIIAKVSRRFQISDADIQDRVARMELDSEDEEGLNVLLRDMRDLLTEQGRYAPQNGQPAQKPLVTV
jgi:hypothetical protein